MQQFFSNVESYGNPWENLCRIIRQSPGAKRADDNGLGQAVPEAAPGNMYISRVVLPHLTREPAGRLQPCNVMQKAGLSFTVLVAGQLLWRNSPQDGQRSAVSANSKKQHQEME